MFRLANDEPVFPSDEGFSFQVIEKIRPQSPIGIMEITVANEFDMDPNDLTAPERRFIISRAALRRRLQEYVSNEKIVPANTSNLFF